MALKIVAKFIIRFKDLTTVMHHDVYQLKTGETDADLEARVRSDAIEMMSYLKRPAKIASVERVI